MKNQFPKVLDEQQNSYVIFHRAYNMPFALREKVESELCKMEK